MVLVSFQCRTQKYLPNIIYARFSHYFIFTLTLVQFIPPVCLSVYDPINYVDSVSAKSNICLISLSLSYYSNCFTTQQGKHSYTTGHHQGSLVSKHNTNYNSTTTTQNFSETFFCCFIIQNILPEVYWYHQM